ncbi:MAG TPA: type I-D CRISPR-associated protein Cas10d/Csc3 [Alphaproteobacteria bacterium]|nr:type I-D CRISPR-associated protein Cas10d/Csc3 [Alphaproteobacteria bacterium]
MVKVEDLEQILDAYVQKIIPAMYRQRYHLILAKGGPNYSHLPEQSMFTHIINGIFGLARLLRFIEERSILIPHLDQVAVRKAFALYTLHDVHKFVRPEQRLGSSEFSLPLERIQNEYRQLDLADFADLDVHLMRAANVSKRSHYQGDVLLGEEPGSFLWVLVRIADSLASMRNLEEISTLERYLKLLAPEFAPKSGKYRLYFHEMRDVRGVLTNLIHSVIAHRFTIENDCYPWLFFATGTLYLGPHQLSVFDRSTVIENAVTDILAALTQTGGGVMAKSSAAEALRRTKYDFEKHVHAFADLPTLLELVLEETQSAKPKPKELQEDIDSIARLKEAPGDWASAVGERYRILLDESRDFNERWSQARRYLLYVDTLLRDVVPSEDRLEWFIRTFALPETVAENLRQDRSLWTKGGLGKYVVVAAYHFLKGPGFAVRSAVERPIADVLAMLHQQVLSGLERIDTRTGREAAVAELGFDEELKAYLREHLSLSWILEAELQGDSLEGYSRPKRKGHSGRICSLCNRASEHVVRIRTGVLGASAQEFSNRVLPQRKINENRCWCPICHLESILRKQVGLSLPVGADYSQSYRVYLYVLPTFCFTPEHITLFERVLRPFRETSNLPVRNFGSASPGLPQLWLQRRELDPQWMGEVVKVFARQSTWITQHGGPGFVGDRLVAGRIAPHPHYYLISWERSVRERERDDARIPTRTEAWAKAILAALVISGLTSTRIYVTECPYLPIADPAELKTTIALDGAPAILRRSLGGQTEGISLYGREAGQQSGLERALDLVSALWVVTADLHRSGQQTKDRQIAGHLGLINVEPLAGAVFYRTYGRLNDDQSPFPIFTRACEVLLEYLGGEMMELAKEVAEKALQIWLPSSRAGRGRAHTYELVFREAIDAVRKAFEAIPDFKAAALTGSRPSTEAVAELKGLAAGTLFKAMERRQQSRRGEGMVNPWRKDLSQLVGEFIDLIVDELFLKRAEAHVARFLRLENTIADGIYYHTDRVITERWKAYHAMRAEKKGADTMAPYEAAARLQEWVTSHSEALTGINAVEAIREARESR